MRFRRREVTLNANWVRSRGGGSSGAVHSLRARPAINAFQPAGFAGGPLPDQGQLVVPGMAGDHATAACFAAGVGPTVWAVSLAGAGDPPAAAWLGSGW
jgi:hypothetical protein